MARTDTESLSMEAVANSIAKITAGLTDEYLRALYEAVVARRKVLDETGSLPVQRKVDMSMATLTAEGKRTIKATVGDPVPAFNDSPAPAKPRRGVKSVRPASGTPHYRNEHLGHIAATVLRSPDLQINHAVDESQYDRTQVFHMNGKAYLKSGFKGKHVEGRTSEGHVILFKIVGIGEKALTVTLASEPPRNAVSGNTNLWDVWSANSKAFAPRDLIAPWIQY